jgi:hypothetical protein
LPAVSVPAGWEASDEGDVHVLRPSHSNPPNAYDVVVEEVLEGDRSMFLSTEVGTAGCGISELSYAQA